ncbi:hypothetical protein LEN26_013801 [Aphanomyces euteiches]|nr:hypothetical protein LEN26_013801 [Aphanomyces euteiches]
MQDQQTINTETLLSMLQQSQEELKIVRATINEQSEDIAILSAYITDYDGQHKTKMKETEMSVAQLRDQVAAVTSDLRAVKWQLTEKTMTTNQHQVAALASELDIAKSRLMKKEEETTQLEDCRWSTTTLDLLNLSRFFIFLHQLQLVQLAGQCCHLTLVLIRGHGFLRQLPLDRPQVARHSSHLVAKLSDGHLGFLHLGLVQQQTLGKIDSI